MEKRILSFIMIITLVISSISISLAETSSETRPTPEEIEILIDAMLAEANNANIDLYTDQYFEIPVSINGLDGVVIIEDKPENNDLSTLGTEYHDITDGNRVLTTTLKADLLLGGEMILRVHYTASDNVSKLNARKTSEDFSPPVGYTDGGTSSWVHKNRDSIIGGTGSYTMKALGAYPLTIRVKTEVMLTNTAGEIQVNYWKEA